MSAESGTRKRSARRTVMIVALVLLLGVVAALTIAGGVAYWMSRQAPEHWRVQQRAREDVDERQLAEMAQAMERRTAARLSDAGPITMTPEEAEAAQVREIHLSFDEINAWLDQRLADWLASQGGAMPEAVREPMLVEQAGDLLLAFRLHTEQMDRIVSVVFNVQVVEPGQARLQVRRVLAGRLPIPVGTVIEQATGMADGQGDVLRVLHGEPFEAVIPIDGQRCGRLVDVHVRPAGVEMVVRVEGCGE